MLITQIYRDNLRSTEFIIILGGHKAPQGTGEIVSGLLSKDEKNYILIKGNRKLFVKRNVWTNDQLVLILAGSDRYATQKAIRENYGKVVELIKSSVSYTIFIDTLPTGIDRKYQNALREAISYWEKREGVTFKEVNTFGEADIQVQWIKEFGTKIGSGGELLGHAVYGTYVQIGLGDSNCVGVWKQYSYDTILRVAIHELGHTLGYDHDENENSVMYRYTKMKYEYDYNSRGILEDRHIKYAYVCTSNSNGAKYSIEITSTQPLDIRVLPTYEDYKKFINRETYTHYPDCQGNQVTFHKKTCYIPKWGIIAFRNSGNNADAQYTLKVKEL